MIQYSLVWLRPPPKVFQCSFPSHHLDSYLGRELRVHYPVFPACQAHFPSLPYIHVVGCDVTQGPGTGLISYYLIRWSSLGMSPMSAARKY